MTGLHSVGGSGGGAGGADPRVIDVTWRATWKEALDAVQLDLEDTEYLLDQLHASAEARVGAAEKLLVRTKTFRQLDGSLGPLPAELADRARMLLGRQLELAGDVARAMTSNRRHAKAAAAMQQRPLAAVPVYIDTEAWRHSMSRFQRKGIALIEAAEPASTVLVCVARQAIFDDRLELVGHELLFRPSLDAQESGLDTAAEHDAATSQMLTATFADFEPEEISGGMPLFVNITRSFVVGDLPLLSGSETLVLEITEDIPMDEHVLAGMARLREEGYSLALDDFVGEAWRMPALPLVDYVKLVLDPDDPQALADQVDLVRREAPSAKIVVERVEDDADLARCRALGVDLLQGYGLERPETLTAKTLQSSQITAMRLIAALTNPDTHLREVERLVEGDPGLSLRVLRAASSSMVASVQAISTVRQALVLLGPRPLTSWAVLTALNPSTNSAQQRVAMTHILHRAGACARMVPRDSHTAYTAGLLSATAEVIGVTIEELLEDVRVHDGVRDALLHFEGEVGRALAALLACEGRMPGRGLEDVEAAAANAYMAALGDAMAGANALTTPI